MTENAATNLTCESCGEQFSCGANVGECWCFAVELKAETAAELRAAFKRCLCENCLEELADKTGDPERKATKNCSKKIKN